MLTGMELEPEFYSIKETAVIFNVHPNTIRHAIQRGFLIAIRVGDGKRSPYRISRRSIDKIHDTIIFQHQQISIKRIEDKK